MFKKGKSGNPAGRPKGAKDKKTIQWEELGEFITTDGAERYKDILMDMKDEDFFKNYTMILEYFKPKQVRQDTFNRNDGSIEVKITYGDKDNRD